MGFADSFRELDLLEQAVALQDLQTGPPAEVLPELLPLYLKPLGDTAADTMVRNALRTMYLQAPEQVAAGLTHENQSVRAMCLDLAGELQLTDVVPNLLQKAEDHAGDPDIFSSTVTALSRIADRTSLPFFRHNVTHEDPLIAALCIKTLGKLDDAESLSTFAAIIEENEQDDRYHTCEIITWTAIEALGTLQSPNALPILSGFIHHRNPTARRIVLETLVNSGKDAITHVAPLLRSEDKDSCIMAANVLRDIGHADASEPLAAALDQGTAHPNISFAIYEALGHTPGLKSLVALTDFLPRESEPTCLLAIIQALDMQASPSVSARLEEILIDRMAARDPQAKRIFEAIINAKAANLFSFLYPDEILARIIVNLLIRSNDTESLDVFIQELKKMDSPRAVRDIARLSPLAVVEDNSRMRMLAIDDSTAMRNFYRTQAGPLGLSVTLAKHGQEALDIVEMSPNIFDIIVVDMNMPVMDGVEFTSKLRAIESYTATPVLMATTEAGRSQAQLARQSGVTSFLPKPFTPEIFQHRLQKLLTKT